MVFAMLVALWRALAVTAVLSVAALDRLDEAFLYSESVDLTSCSRQRDKLREELAA